VNYTTVQAYTFSSFISYALAQKFELQMLSAGDYDLLALIPHGPTCKLRTKWSRDLRRERSCVAMRRYAFSLLCYSVYAEALQWAVPQSKYYEMFRASTASKLNLNRNNQKGLISESKYE
jgi:hypothetical protein